MRNFDEFVGMDKEAAARWKKEFGNLSESAKSTLKKKVAKTSEDMVKGIERGNKELIRKLGEKGHLSGVVSHRNTPAIYKHIKQGPGKDANPILRYATTRLAKLNGAATVPSNNDQGGDPGKALIMGFRKGLFNKDKYKMTSRTVKRMLKPKDPELGRMSRSDKRAVDALTLRHELDEARSMIRNGVHIGKYVSHNAPDVIHRESANLALMPEKVKRAFVNQRKEHPSRTGNPLIDGLNKKVMGGRLPITGGELESLGNRGVRYGESPYLDKKKMRQHMKDYLAGKETIDAAR